LQWLANKESFDIDTSIDIIEKIRKIIEFKINHQDIQSGQQCENNFFKTLCFVKADLVEFNPCFLDSFISHFSKKIGTINKDFLLPSDINELLFHPIIETTKDTFFVPAIFNLYQALYESPFYWFQKDNSYITISAQNRGKVTEEIAHKLLVPVFGDNNVFSNVEIKGANHKTIGEIDVLAIKGNKALIIQAKSKRLTWLSKAGKIEDLLNDFDKAIQESYQQGLFCRESILNRTNAFFIDNNKIKLDETIDDVYMVCLTSDVYPAMTLQTQLLLNKKPEQPSPISLSLFDLDILSYYLTDPYEFLYYIRQRVALLDHFIADNEIVFLAYHLKNKLYGIKKFNKELLESSISEYLIEDFNRKRGFLKTMINFPENNLCLWKNEKITQLVDAIKESKDAGFTDAVFFLYDISGDYGDELNRNLELIKKKTLIDDKNHDLSISSSDNSSGVTIISMRSGQISKYLVNHCVARKYKAKADVWLGLGTLSSSEKLVDCFVFCKQPWKYDPHIEELSRKLLKTGTALKTKFSKTGRNQPCPCGSGFKYKKCCGM
jgi:hypothetical protein